MGPMILVDGVAIVIVRGGNGWKVAHGSPSPGVQGPPFLVAESVGSLLALVRTIAEEQQAREAGPVPDFPV
ncbi:conserved protein of unknown function (plasmid) [Rhodovastum atsumiense]|uniref:Uncharacterized protein n=1 Tax=Rhodovastum atsumiense TaxID=504468 RepID=A0A5M6ITA5_9PROT|nr:hypothetical protein [Rhodovastum atsumiense]KAA5611546.1 hypothetical protein F1189_13345 [Rhodovastum atsumiense]CAH2606228.1 conserved protein of unknown function [Rhodovastum atsumiense]